MDKIHFIAIGGAAMHNLALALHQNGYQISGSDDEINEPSRSRLLNAGLLPSEMGWFPEKLTSDIHAVILGMHARADNPELIRAQELGLSVFSYPEFLYEQSKNKKRVVIGGSHGKTTITAMILHVLKTCHIDFDYMVGSQLEGFDTMVRLSDAPYIILEGDEYLSSAVDRRPKFHLYKADIALISGIAWDHINVFPQYELYKEQFRIFIRNLPENGVLVYCNDDIEVRDVISSAWPSVKRKPYHVPLFRNDDGICYLITDKGDVELNIFGKHNLQNLEGARLICAELGIDDAAFYSAITSFKGAARRLELVFRNDNIIIYKDFAHSPSKLKATIAAVKENYPDRKLVAVMELHTFSSLNVSFLNEYASTMNQADEAIVFYSQHTIERKKMTPFPPEDIQKYFQRNDVLVINNKELLLEHLVSNAERGEVLLMMSSGTFDGLDWEQLKEQMK